jgi:glutathione S-transferase
MHPVSNTSRPVRMMIQDYDLPIEEEVVDLMTGAHHKEPYASMNPNRLVPMLEEDGFRLTESSAILKYLAEKFDLPVYPKDLKKRAKVNELMDWFNTNFYRDYGYGVVYPQIFPHHKRPSDEMQKGTVAWGKENTKKWLQVLNDHWLGKGNKYLAGDELTIADYFGAAILTCGDPIRTEFKNYPNVAAWLERMGKTKSWSKCNEAMWGFRDYIKDQQFETV